ncbi:unnamed protein product [Fraxinus pennsylvanica]|uniref:DDE Tnp4 domain-containing protein n=1 Tax=Fraxinus pennsylvanica TaxID=56036 RepID=A0AAD1YW58_9LAMI|nr:unnamed protein product [Fraxinus pennsylvanica]
MDSLEDEKDGGFQASIPKELGHPIASIDFFEPPNSVVSQEIRKDPRFFPYFLNCVGAVDDIHFPVTVGSAPDMRVLNSAITRRNKLEVPDGKYYLVDSKYANVPGFIAPYPGESVLQLEDPMPPLEIEQPLVPTETQLSDIPFVTEELEDASQLRDSIASEIWNDYIRDYAIIDKVV